MEKIAIPICRIEYYDNTGDLATYNEDRFVMYEDITELREWSNGGEHSIELIYEERGSAWVIRVTPRVKEKNELHALAKEAVKKELLAQSNRIGRRWKDEEGWIWYG